MAGKKRYTVGLGFLLDYVYENYAAGIFKSVQEACAEKGLDFIGFEAGFSRVPAAGLYLEKKNTVIDLIGQRTLDGMILLAEHAANTLTDAEVKKLYRNLAGVPIVSIGRSARATISVLIDNKHSMRELVTHLVKEHRYRRIAFLNGPDTSADGRQRFEAYKETLRDFGLAIQEKLIVYGGDYYSSGADAVKILLDQRRAEFDAIVAANDSMAIFALKELERRGIRVPADVAVAGFDGIEDGRRLSPRLTTIQQSYYDIGRESVKAMRAVLAGEKAPRRIVVPTRLIIRESCGCEDSDKLERILFRGGRPDAKKGRSVRDECVRLVAELGKKLPFLLEKPGVRTAVEELADALPAGEDEAGRRIFFRRVGTLFGRLLEMKEDLDTVSQLTVSFFSAAGSCCDDPVRKEMFHGLFEGSLILLAGLSAKAPPSGPASRITIQDGIELIVNDDFSNLLHLDRLKEIVIIQLLKLQFRRFYVCLYTDPSRREAKLLMQYNTGAGDGARTVSDRSPFPAKQLLPDQIRDDSGFAYMVVALYFKEADFGYMLFDVADLVGEPVYDDLATQICGAINSAMQAKAIHEYAGQLEEKVKQVKERTSQLELAIQERVDFFNAIAHEIKNPLTLISNYLNSYIAKQGLSEELKVLKSNFEALLDVMAEYLSWGKIERGKIVYRHDQTADFSGIVRNDVILFRETASRKNIRLDAAVEPGVFVAVDPEALERVVENLLQNAVRFTKAGGNIKIALRRKEDEVEFSVKDTGVGLTAEQMKHIFKRYYQVTDAGEGAVGIGLGLDIVKKILDEFGAGIRVTSVRGKGTTFICSFVPVRGKAPVRVNLRRAALAGPNGVGNASAGECCNLLFVEDNAELLSYLIDNTKHLFNVFHATDGLDALEKLRHIPKPNIIVSDVLMDNMDGFKLFEELMKHENYRDIPFLFLTGVNTRTDRLKALDKGAVDYIAKPFLIDELIAKIQSNLRIQNALKKKNLFFLGSKVYQAIEAEFRRYEDETAESDMNNLERLYVKHGITKKEIEVISLLKLGLPQKQIASRLDISINTLSTHLTHIYKKCNVNSALELFAKLK
ncbi:MAG: substrate-binding domain-containing protein [Spirochaetales bacterium]|nr:substrate-binding domain-containing protein [Spirochaetales bacterium]